MKTQLTDKASISAVLAEMTLEEKLTLLTGDTTFRGGKNEAHGIPAPLLLDGGTGFNYKQMLLETLFVAQEERQGKYDPETIKGPLEPFRISSVLAARTAREKDTNPDMKYVAERAVELLEEVRPADGNLGCYPPGMFLGATMNPKIVHDCGEAVGREASACHIDVLLGSPNVNIQRDPKNGRVFEGYSEDPCVTSKLAPHFVEGVQSTGVVANVKHFAANNQETDRMGVLETIDERALREIYFPGFKACVEHGCKTVMSAYNRINGTACAENPWLLKDVLRGEWGFQGFVMSDWGAMYDRVGGMKAGNDVTMPGPREIGCLVKAVENGELDEKEIDEACRNYLQILLEMPIMKGRKYSKIDVDYSMEAAYRIACEGITLLKNDGVLPLNRDNGIAFYGDKCKKYLECGTGSAAVVTNLSTNVYESAQKLLGEEKVSFGEITEYTGAVVAVIGAGGGEGADRADLQMDALDRKELERAIRDAKAAGKPVVLILNIAGAVEIMDYVDQADAILCVYFPGMAGGRATMDILLGDVNPSGKLPFTYPKYDRDTPTYLNFPGENQHVNYGEGIYVGYRYYDKKQVEPLYPFMYGLSYTEFAK